MSFPTQNTVQYWISVNKYFPLLNVVVILHSYSRRRNEEIILNVHLINISGWIGFILVQCYWISNQFSKSSHPTVKEWQRDKTHENWDQNPHNHIRNIFAHYLNACLNMTVGLFKSESELVLFAVFEIWRNSIWKIKK